MFSCCSRLDGPGTSYFASRGSTRHGARNRILIPCFLKTRRHEQPPRSKSSCVRPMSTTISNQPIRKIKNPSIPMRFFAKRQFRGSFRQIKLVVSLFLVYLISNSFSASCCSWTSRVHNFRQYCCECPQWHHRVAQPEANLRQNYSYVQGPHDST